MEMKVVQKNWTDKGTGETKAYEAVVLVTPVGEISLRFKDYLTKNLVIKFIRDEQEAKKAK